MSIAGVIIMERRSSPRGENSIEGELVFENKKIPCSVQNISEGGVLVRIDEEYTVIITKNDVGKKIHFKILSDSKPEMEYHGRIIRVMDDKIKMYIAIFFLKN
jgi:hypothetical protein